MWHYTVFWNDILQQVDATNQSLQSTKLDLNTTVASLTRCSLKDFVFSTSDSTDSNSAVPQCSTWYTSLWPFSRHTTQFFIVI